MLLFKSSCRLTFAVHTVHIVNKFPTAPRVRAAHTQGENEEGTPERDHDPLVDSFHDDEDSLEE